MTPRSEKGFSLVVVLLIIVVLAVGGGGYLVYKRHQNATKIMLTNSRSGALAVPTNQSNTASGVASAVNSLATSLNSGQSSLDGQYNANDVSSDANLGVAANDLGGTYDASNY